MHIVNVNYSCVFIPMRVFTWFKCICIYSYGAFLWLIIVKMGFLFGFNVYVFVPMVLFLSLKIVKNYQKMWMMFLFGVNVYLFIPMVPFYN